MIGWYFYLLCSHQSGATSFPIIFFHSYKRKMPLKDSREGLLPLNTGVNQSPQHYSYGTSSNYLCHGPIVSALTLSSGLPPPNPLAPFPTSNSINSISGLINSNNNNNNSIHNHLHQDTAITGKSRNASASVCDKKLFMPQPQCNMPRSMSFSNSGQNASGGFRRNTGLDSSSINELLPTSPAHQQHQQPSLGTPSFALRPPHYSPATSRRATNSSGNSPHQQHQQQLPMSGQTPMSAYFSPNMITPMSPTISLSNQQHQGVGGGVGSRLAYIDELKGRSSRSSTISSNSGSAAGSSLRPHAPSLSRRSSAGNLMCASSSCSSNNTGSNTVSSANSVTNNINSSSLMSAKEHSDFPAMLENSIKKQSSIKTIDEETVQFVLQEEEQYKKVLKYFQLFITVALVYFVSYKLFIH